MESGVGAGAGENTRTNIQGNVNSAPIVNTRSKILNTRSKIQSLMNQIKGYENKSRKIRAQTNISDSGKDRTIAINITPYRRPVENELEVLRKKLTGLEQNQRNETRKASRKSLRNKGIIDYIVVRGVEDFELDVMKKLSEGYVLQGGVSVSNSFYMQAMVKINKPLNLLANNANLLHL